MLPLVFSNREFESASSDAETSDSSMEDDETEAVVGLVTPYFTVRDNRHGTMDTGLITTMTADCEAKLTLAQDGGTD